MNLQEAIKHTINKGGMKVSVGGVASAIGRSKGRTSNADKFMIDSLQKHFYQAREAWLKGDLETVAEFFGLYV